MKLSFDTRRLQPVKAWLAVQWRAIKRLEKDDLDLQTAGQWPDALKALTLILLLIMILFASNWLLISGVREELDQTRTEQEELFERYQLRSFQAANLGAYQQQMQIMEGTFSELLSRLPIDREIPHLIENIQAQASRQRLELQAVNLRDDQRRDFYTELPFEIQARGDFHRLASFMAGISSLDRIITLHDFTLSPVAGVGQPTQLNLRLQARTYRYDESSQATASRRQP
jgi:type IV pilus assembly protein PilO